MTLHDTKPLARQAYDAALAGIFIGCICGLFKLFVTMTSLGLIAW